uniref:Uncharacterized protein n=1 Tax=Oryza glumipatula TaxID=40148 RepID=A0A0E0AT55_9ORYZ
MSISFPVSDATTVQPFFSSNWTAAVLVATTPTESLMRQAKKNKPYGTKFSIKDYTSKHKDEEGGVNDIVFNARSYVASTGAPATAELQKLDSRVIQCKHQFADHTTPGRSGASPIATDRSQLHFLQIRNLLRLSH